MIGRVRRAVAGVLLTLALAGCAAFPDAGPREWQEKVEGAGELGGPPVVPEPGASDEQQPPPADSDPSATAEPMGCDDPAPPSSPSGPPAGSCACSAGWTRCS